MAENKGRMDDKRYRRQKLREAALIVAAKAEEEGLFKRQIPEEDMFQELYGELNLLTPPYPFENLYIIYEESDVLQECVDTMRKNIDGFGYDLQFTGDDIKDKDSTQATAERQRAMDFFDHANEKQSWTTIRKLMREDYEVLGNGSFEIIRSRDGGIALAYYLPFKNIRLCALMGDPVPITVLIPRNGKIMRMRVKKYFRKYAQMDLTGKKLRWFKEFGDPRTLDALTGDYVTSKPKMAASELWHFKQPFGGKAYGLPRWVGATPQVLGRRSACYINNDLFENQGIPPMAIMVSGGVLTDESLDELEEIVLGARGVEKFNRPLILESNVEGLGLEEKGAAKIELKNLTEYRNSDQMFGKYTVQTGEDVRHCFRLPPIYVGATSTYTLATSKASKTVAEEQVFIPERESFDEIMNLQIMQGELDIKLWKFISRGPRIVGAEEISSGVEAFARVGAFSVNHAIEMANSAFGLQMSKFTDKWADYPIPVVLEMLKSGKLAGLEDIEKEIEEVNEPLKQLGMGGKPPVQDEGKEKKKKPLALPAPTEKSEVFSATEENLYKMLLGLQAAIEHAEACDASQERL